MSPHICRSTVAMSRFFVRGSATHIANGAATAVALTAGFGMRSRLRRSGTATPAATSAHAPDRMTEGRKVRLIIWPSADGGPGFGGLADEALDDPRQLVGLRMPLHAEGKALVGRLDGLGQVVQLGPARDLQPVAEAIDALMVVGLGAVDPFAGRALGQRAGLEAHVVVSVVERAQRAPVV